jgi:hypothetical protein
MEAIPIRNFGDNIYAPLSGIRKIPVKPSQTSLVSKLRESALTVCKNQISPNYIKEIFKPFSNGFTGGLVFQSEDDSEIQGFVVWELKGSYTKFNSLIEHPDDDIRYNTMYIKLICAKENDKNLGKHLLYESEKYCTENGIHFITLEAATEKLVPYYEKMGYILFKDSFIHPKTNKQIDIFTVKKHVLIFPKHKTNNFRTKYTRKQKKPISSENQ